MKRSRLIASTVMLVLAVSVLSVSITAGASSEGKAQVTVIQGTARAFSKGDAKGRVLKKGDALGKEQEVKVAERSRMEIRFPDGSVIRLSEKSHLKLSDVAYTKQTGGKKVNADLSTGKLWANVTKMTTADSSFEVKTSNAVAGVRGTVYQMNVNADNSAMVRVYDGTVYVANPPRDPSRPAGALTPPREVSGPHQVPPPYHEVSREEWTAIVKAMQQITISPQGVPSKPEDFDPKADASDWVRWNQERDKETSF